MEKDAAAFGQRPPLFAEARKPRDREELLGQIEDLFEALFRRVAAGAIWAASAAEEQRQGSIQ